jgi:enoyl-CoA hydratase/carnithine racemase
MSAEPVLVERRETSALVTLNRPEKHNALSFDLLGRLQTILRELGEDAGVRVVILRGNDRCFSTGMDLDDLASVTGVADAARGHPRRANAAISAARPVIAAIAGWCLTGGLEPRLRATCASLPNARFGITSARIGTVAGAGAQLCLIGAGRAGSPVLGRADRRRGSAADRARESRRASRARGRDALEMARLWARRAPLGLWFAKHAVNVGLTMPLEAALAFEIGLTTQLFTTEDRAEGLRAFQEKRDAHFRGR